MVGYNWSLRVRALRAQTRFLALAGLCMASGALANTAEVEGPPAPAEVTAAAAGTGTEASAPTVAEPVQEEVTPPPQFDDIRPRYDNASEAVSRWKDYRETMSSGDEQARVEAASKYAGNRVAGQKVAVGEQTNGWNLADKLRYEALPAIAGTDTPMLSHEQWERAIAAMNQDSAGYANGYYHASRDPSNPNLLRMPTLAEAYQHNGLTLPPEVLSRHEAFLGRVHAFENPEAAVAPGPEEVPTELGTPGGGGMLGTGTGATSGTDQLKQGFQQATGGLGQMAQGFGQMHVDGFNKAREVGGQVWDATKLGTRVALGAGKELAGRAADYYMNAPRVLPKIQVPVTSPDQLGDAYEATGRALTSGGSTGDQLANLGSNVLNAGALTGKYLAQTPVRALVNAPMALQQDVANSVVEAPRKLIRANERAREQVAGGFQGFKDAWASDDSLLAKTGNSVSSVVSGGLKGAGEFGKGLWEASPAKAAGSAVHSYWNALWGKK